jgi:hypothetical protein
MGDPTHRFYRQRQQELGGFLVDLVAIAYVRRAMLLQRKAWGPWSEKGMLGLGLSYQAADISRADNKAMAEAAKSIVEAFNTMAERGWITDELAVKLAFRFAGEVLSDEEIKAILSSKEYGVGSKEEQPNGEEETETDPDAGANGRDGLGRRNGHQRDSTAALSPAGWHDLPDNWR